MRKALVSCALLTLPAQVETGTITGSVTDPGGLVVPNAQVSIKSADTGLSNVLQTNDTGRFQSPPLKPVGQDWGRVRHSTSGEPI